MALIQKQPKKKQCQIHVGRFNYKKEKENFVVSNNPSKLLVTQFLFQRLSWLSITNPWHADLHTFQCPPTIDCIQM